MSPSSRRSNLVGSLSVAVALLGAGAATPASGQGLLPSAAGAVAGTGVGTAAAVAAVVARARLAGAYLWSPDDVIGWPVAVVAAGTASGIVLGAQDRRSLARAAVGATALGAVGAGLGAIIGTSTFDDEGGAWAGAFMGAGVGAVVGWVVGAALDDTDDPVGGGVPLAFHLRLPVGR